MLQDRNNFWKCRKTRIKHVCNCTFRDLKDSLKKVDRETITPSKNKRIEEMIITEQMQWLQLTTISEIISWNIRLGQPISCNIQRQLCSRKKRKWAIYLSKLLKQGLRLTSSAVKLNKSIIDFKIRWCVKSTLLSPGLASLTQINEYDLKTDNSIKK